MDAKKHASVRNTCTFLSWKERKEKVYWIIMRPRAKTQAPASDNGAGGTAWTNQKNDENKREVAGEDG